MANLVKLFLCALLLLLTSCNKDKTSSSNANNDSIKKYLALASNDTLAFDLRNQYNKKAFSLIDLSKNDTVTRFYLSENSRCYLRLSNWKELKKVSKLHFQKSIEKKDTLNLARYYRYKAGFFIKTLVNDSSFYYYLKAEKFYKSTNDEKGLAMVYLYKSDIQFRLDDYLGANLSAKKAYAYFKNTNEPRFQYDALTRIGNTNHTLRDYENAIKAFKIAIVIAKTNKLKEKSGSLIGSCLNNIGNAYREQKIYNKALYYFNLALKEKNLMENDPSLMGYLLNNLSDCKLHLKDYSGVPNLLIKSIDLLKNGEDIKESAISYIYLSNYYFAIDDTLKAQLYAQKALKIAKLSKAPYYYLTTLSNAGSVDSQRASKYIIEYHQKNDSLLFIERNARNQYYKIQFETDEISKEKETAIKQKWIIGSIAIVVILIIVLLLIITRQRSKQKELQFLQTQQKANEEIYDLMLSQKSVEEQARQTEKKRIALELHDGIMNKLASTRLNLFVLSQKTDAATIEKCLTYISGIHTIEQEIRNIAHDLNQNVFKESIVFPP